MKSAIRLAVVVMMAGASTAALATTGDSYEAETDQTTVDDLAQMKFETATPTDASDDKDVGHDQDIGHGSGEPGSSETATKADQATAEKAAIDEYNQRNFLNHIWSDP